jgi:predicted small integral membrane protein
MSRTADPGLLERVLPFELELGDRIFLGVATFIAVNLLWLKYMTMELLPAAIIGFLLFVVIVRWG